MEIKATATEFNKEGSHVRGRASATFNGHMAIHGIKIVESTKEDKGLFVQMPSWVGYKEGNSPNYNNVVFPITAEARAELMDTVMEAFANRESTQRAENIPGEMPKVTVSLKENTHEGHIKATGQIVLDDELVVNGIKVIEGEKGLFVQLPSYMTDAGVWKDIAHPITAEFREKLNNAVLNKYHDLISAVKMGNTAFKDLGERDDIKFFKIPNATFAEKVGSALDEAGVKWSGKKLDGKVTLSINKADEDAYKELRGAVQEKEIEKQKAAQPMTR